MDPLIKIALLLVAAIAAVSAIGGDTWKKQPGPFYRAVTRRGWIAVVCVVASFALGVWNEVRSRDREHESTERERKLHEAVDALRSQLAVGLTDVIKTLTETVASLPELVRHPVDELQVKSPEYCDSSECRACVLAKRQDLDDAFATLERTREVYSRMWAAVEEKVAWADRFSMSIPFAGLGWTSERAKVLASLEDSKGGYRKRCAELQDKIDAIVLKISECEPTVALPTQQRWHNATASRLRHTISKKYDC